jgi:hypothetical protein
MEKGIPYKQTPPEPKNHLIFLLIVEVQLWCILNFFINVIYTQPNKCKKHNVQCTKYTGSFLLETTFICDENI